MAKRMTDTEKWKKPFIKSLSPEMKLLWLYLLDDCDHSGIWHVDIEVAEIRLGFKIDLKNALRSLAEKLVVFDDGNKWFIPDFIFFQYGELTEKNKMYKPVSTQLQRYNLMGHISPINGVKVQVQDKDTKGGMGGNGEMKLSLEHCRLTALLDETWVMNVKPTKEQFDEFDKHLTGLAEHMKTPKDYKSHFYNWRSKQKPSKDDRPRITRAL